MFCCGLTSLLTCWTTTSTAPARKPDPLEPDEGALEDHCPLKKATQRGHIIQRKSRQISISKTDTTSKGPSVQVFVLRSFTLGFLWVDQANLCDIFFRWVSNQNQTKKGCPFSQACLGRANQPVRDLHYNSLGEYPKHSGETDSYLSIWICVKIVFFHKKLFPACIT